MTNDDRTYRVDGFPYPLAKDQYERFHRPSMLDTAEFHYRMLPEREQKKQALARCEYEIVKLYCQLVRWFTEDKVDLSVSSISVPGENFDWGCTFGYSGMAFRKWLPKTTSELQVIADAVSGGAYDIAEMAEICVRQGFDSKPFAKTISEIEQIYDRVCWDYQGTQLPSPPFFGGWKRCLEWFVRCQNSIGISSSLAAYAKGVPIEDIVLRTAEEDRNEWLHKTWVSSGWTDFSYPSRFPNMQ